jgi:hypothetical protein
MGNPLDYAPIAAAAFAIPQFLPKLGKLRATDDPAGISWPWVHRRGGGCGREGQAAGPAPASRWTPSGATVG